VLAAGSQHRQAIARPQPHDHEHTASERLADHDRDDRRYRRDRESNTAIPRRRTDLSPGDG